MAPADPAPLDRTWTRTPEEVQLVAARRAGRRHPSDALTAGGGRRQSAWMAFDEILAARVRAVLDGEIDFDEKRMFGGVAFMVNTHMACGVLGDDLMVRVGRDLYEDALRRGATEMDFTGRPMRGLVMVAGELLDDDALAEWLDRAISVALSEPPKKAKG